MRCDRLKPPPPVTSITTSQRGLGFGGFMRFAKELILYLASQCPSQCHNRRRSHCDVVTVVMGGYPIPRGWSPGIRLSR